MSGLQEVFAGRWHDRVMTPSLDATVSTAARPNHMEGGGLSVAYERAVSTEPHTSSRQKTTLPDFQGFLWAVLGSNQ